MSKSFIKIIDPGILKKVGEFHSSNECDLETIFKAVRITMVAETNRLQSLYLCELLGSYSIQSQRYCRYNSDVDKNTIIVNEQVFTDEELLMIKKQVYSMTKLYLEMTKLKSGHENKTKFTSDDFEYNIPIDDGRYILPMVYKCNTEFTLDGEKFLKFLAMLITEPEIFGNLYAQITMELLRYIDIDTFEVLKLKAIYINSSRVISSDFFNFIAGSRENHNVIHLLDNGCEYSAMHKSGAGALICTTSDKGVMDILGEPSNESEETFRKITERVAVGTHHTSIAENSSFVFLMKQSVPCYNQYVRHRHQETLREDFDIYSIINTGKLPMIIPDSIRNSQFIDVFNKEIIKLTSLIKLLYDNSYNRGNSELNDLNNTIRINTIKQLLPMGYELRIICTTNLINETYKGTKRICNKAHWEIGNITRKSLNLIKEKIGKDNKLLQLCRPGCCTDSGCHEGKFRCKDNSNVLEIFNKENM